MTLAIAATCLAIIVVALMVPSILRTRPRHVADGYAGFLLAVATACFVPLLMGNQYGQAKPTSIGAHTLLYSVPWAIAVGLVFVGSRPRPFRRFDHRVGAPADDGYRRPASEFPWETRSGLLSL